MPCIPEDEVITLVPTNDYRWQNFVQTIDYLVPSYFRVRNLGELVWVVSRAHAEGRRLKAAGSGWSIENIATSEDWVVDLSALNARLTYLVEAGVGSRALTDYWHERQFSDTSSERLVHVEAGIKLIDLNRSLEPELAMPTLGGGQGQTLAGAVSTATHGSDIEHPCLSDLIEAVHLVTNDGQEVWIESASHPVTRNDEQLRLVLPCADTRIIRDDDALDAVRCSAGRFGVIYAYVVKVTRAFRLSEYAQFLNWVDVRAALASGIGLGNTVAQRAHLGSINSLLSPPPFDLRIDVSPTEYRYFDITFNTRKPEQCWVRRRWITRESGDIAMAASDNFLCHPTIGNVILGAAAAMLEAYGFAILGIPIYGAIKKAEIDTRVTALRTMALEPGMTGGRALAASVNAITRSQIFGGELSWMIDEISQIGLSGEFTAATTTGKRGSNWQVTSGVDETAFRPDCYNGSSIELTFSLATTAYLDFLDELLSHTGDYLQVGYVSVRFSRGSKALLSMHGVDYPMACAIEVTSLRGLAGTQRWLSWLLERGIALGGRPHWGQQNDLGRAQVETLYTDRLTRWRNQLYNITGAAGTFSNDYTQQRGLEPVALRRHVTGVRRGGGAITQLCGEGYWSPVPVEMAELEILFGGITYYVTAPDGSAEQPVIVRRILTTAADDTSTNNLDSLPAAPGTFPSPPPTAGDLVVTSVIRGTDRWRTIRYLCNVTEGWCVSRAQAYVEIRGGTRRYYTEGSDGARATILARSYLTTAADATEANNLSSLPEC